VGPSRPAAGGDAGGCPLCFRSSSAIP
jgi:hypothetical protein